MPRSRRVPHPAVRHDGTRSMSAAPGYAANPGASTWHLAEARKASRMERAAWWRRRGVRNIAFQHDSPAPLARVRIGHRHRRHQRLRVRCIGLSIQRRSGTFFDDPAEIHHRDPVGNAPHHREIMGDEQAGEPKFALQILPSRLMICAWIETSSAATGSSRISRRGASASARASPMRCRCPPENSRG